MEERRKTHCVDYETTDNLPYALTFYHTIRCIFFCLFVFVFCFFVCFFFSCFFLFCVCVCVCVGCGWGVCVCVFQKCFDNFEIEHKTCQFFVRGAKIGLQRLGCENIFRCYQCGCANSG